MLAHAALTEPVDRDALHSALAGVRHVLYAPESSLSALDADSADRVSMWREAAARQWLQGRCRRDCIC